MVKSRERYYYCTNKDCKKGKVRAIRRSHWKTNHTCSFEMYAKDGYGSKSRLPMLNRSDKKKKRSGAHATLECTNPYCPIKLAKKNYTNIRSNKWLERHTIKKFGHIKPCDREKYGKVVVSATENKQK